MWKNWIQERWYEFRAGDAGYLRYTMSFLQFILLTYALGIERFPQLTGIFSHLWIYAIIFVGFYVPVSVITGHLHRKKQLRIAEIIAVEQNPIGGYHWLIFMQQFMKYLEKNNIPITPEYKQLMEYWGTIAKGWKPPA
jgi:hypothetical protein